MSIVLNNLLHNSTKENSRGNNYRCQLFINGRFHGSNPESTHSNFSNSVNNLGPQAFPAPEGILNHEGDNHIALTLWA
ncbi:hypothetical protein N7489_001184 [Penicillium chrysogenum]|uniref:Beta-galactosidase jelly roll domain-containing protein n=1 Tax=Penicillium chrysogenum TaxID=5076 RepID=A0ABQ8WI60_PENCH|nr:uncharacterized protein N7489_001184 [Penicillium chrysogenum]KAJ5250774.1 hypothetical protein N7489_001184 [Penicillium chrysogenum]KAJ5266383.1 hypothetical protein N7524_007401 [Penicillium chrysogenum]KAJ5269672.1 hypothetical protein N7505_005430 [Penicillium chrysogenum]KAJ6147597.1 hypothetical protein N7497_009579 [Penicillium chrysogenum]